MALLAIILILVALYAHSSIFATSTTDDQNRHHAAVNGFLRDEPLGWSEPYYETGNAIADRMYLTYWVLAQALVVEISDVPILLARYLINPFVMIMAVAGMYVFARNLGHRRQTSLIYIILGLLAYSLVTDMGPQPGSQFSSALFWTRLSRRLRSRQSRFPAPIFALSHVIRVPSSVLCSPSWPRAPYMRFQVVSPLA